MVEDEPHLFLVCPKSNNLLKDNINICFNKNINNANDIYFTHEDNDICRKLVRFINLSLLLRMLRTKTLYVFAIPIYMYIFSLYTFVTYLLLQQSNVLLCTLYKKPLITIYSSCIELYDYIDKPNKF